MATLFFKAGCMVRRQKVYRLARFDDLCLVHLKNIHTTFFGAPMINIDWMGSWITWEWFHGTPMVPFGGDWIPGSFSDNVTGSWGISWCFVRARPHHDPQPNKAHSQQIPYFPVSTRKTLRCTSYNNILGISENEGPQKHPLKYVEFLSLIAHIFDSFRFTKKKYITYPIYYRCNFWDD